LPRAEQDRADDALRTARQQTTARAALVADRQLAAGRLADLKVQQATVETQRARVTTEAGPALYLAKLFGSNDTERMVR
jgi:uncharacterized protein involved in exopolysaccharide biosynthesis